MYVYDSDRITCRVNPVVWQGMHLTDTTVDTSATKSLAVAF